MLEPFQVALGGKIYDGEITIGKSSTAVCKLLNLILFFKYLSGTSIIRFPPNGYMARFSLKDQSDDLLRKTQRIEPNVPILGLLTKEKGRMAIFGDSSCLDSAATNANNRCFWLLDLLLQFCIMSKLPDDLLPILSAQVEEYINDDAHFPMRPDDNLMEKYSKVDPALVIVANAPAFNMSKASIGRNLNHDPNNAPASM